MAATYLTIPVLDVFCLGKLCDHFVVFRLDGALRETYGLSSGGGFLKCCRPLSILKSLREFACLEETFLKKEKPTRVNESPPRRDLLVGLEKKKSCSQLDTKRNDH